MSFKFLLQIFILISLQVQAGTQVLGTVANRDVKNQCAQLATLNPSCPKLSEPLNSAIQVCEVQMQSSLCKNLSKQEPEFAFSLKKCDPQHFCEDELTPLSLSLHSCLQGWLEGTGDGVAQLIESLAKQFAEKNSDIRNCDLDCKRVRAVDLEKYKNLSDQDLDRISALTITLERDEFLYQKRLKILASSVNPLNRKLADSDDQHFLNGVAAWLDRKISRNQCLDAATRAELTCWGAAYIVDPMMVVGVAAKGFRAAKLITMVVAEQKLAKGILNGAKFEAEKVAGVESRTAVVRVLSEENLIGQKLRTLDLPSLPKSMQVAEYKAADGSKYLALERTILLMNGKTVKSIRELPVDPITGAFDANYKTGKEFLDKILKDSDGRSTVMLVDVNNLGDINKNFSGRMLTGDQHLKNEADAISKPSGMKAVLFKYGGDEFINVTSETDPVKVKILMDQIIAESHGPHVREIFDKEKEIRMNQFLESEDLKALQDRIPYLREGISIGASRAGRGEPLEQVVARAEDLAKKMKIEAKEQANISAVKYGGKPSRPNRIPNTRFISKAELPAEGHDALVFPSEIVPLEAVIVSLKEKRVKELFRSGTMTLAQFVDEAGENIIRVEKYIDLGKGQKVKSVREVFLNQRTGLIDVSHPSGQALAVEMAKVAKPIDHLHAIGIDIKNFGPVNYFKELSSAGDKYLVATTKVLETTSAKLGGSALNFKMNGAKFIMTGNIKPSEVENFVRELNNALVNDPGVQKIFSDQKNILQKEFREAGQDYQRQSEILQKIKDLEKISPSFDIRSTSLDSVNSFETIAQRLFNN
jgi:GGDEF domain-containing protein